MGRNRSARLAICGFLIAAAPALKSAGPLSDAGPAGDAAPAQSREASLSSPSRKNLSSDLSRLAGAAVEDGKAAGISFTVRKGITVLAEGAFGFADLENRVPAGVDTVYAIGSLTKQFTATAVLLLADEGRLSLDDPLGKFVPGPQTRPERHSVPVPEPHVRHPQYDEPRTEILGTGRPGGLPGFDGWAAYFPEDELTIVILCNTDADAAMEVADAMAGRLLGVPGAKTKAPGR